MFVVPVDLNPQNPKAELKYAHIVGHPALPKEIQVDNTPTETDGHNDRFASKSAGLSSFFGNLRLESEMSIFLSLSN
jgi:hypothetical protein